MEPWETPTLNGYSCEEVSSRTTWSRLLLKKRRNKAKYLTWNSSRLKFVKKTSMLNCRSLGYIRCYSSSSPRPVKRPSNFTRCNCQKFCSWSRRPKTLLKIRKKGHIFLGDQQSCYLRQWRRSGVFIVKDFTIDRKKTNRTVDNIAVSIVVGVSFWYNNLYFLVLFTKTKFVVNNSRNSLIYQVANHW